MNNVASINPGIPAENAQCAAPASRWNQLAHLVGARLARLGTGRAIRQTEPGEIRGVLDDLVRRGLVARARGGWYRITDAGLLAFPSERCARWRQAFDMIWIDLDAQRARACTAQLGCGLYHHTIGSACDVRPEAWRPTSAALCRPCTPHRTPAEPRRGKVPAQVVHGSPTSELEERHDVPSLDEILELAPECDADAVDSLHYQGDVFPAARIGYPGLVVRRTYA